MVFFWWIFYNIIPLLASSGNVSVLRLLSEKSEFQICQHIRTGVGLRLWEGMNPLHPADHSSSRYSLSGMLPAPWASCPLWQPGSSGLCGKHRRNRRPDGARRYRYSGNWDCHGRCAGDDPLA